MPTNPFGDDAGAPRRRNPFGGDDDHGTDALDRIEHAAVTVRNLKTQLGAEGLTLNATRTLLDEVSAALDAVVRLERARAAGGGDVDRAGPGSPESIA